MLTFRGNNELALHVPDPATAVAFYVDVLGCTEVSRTPDCIEVTNGALRLFLLLSLRRHRAGATGRRVRAPTSACNRRRA